MSGYEKTSLSKSQSIHFAHFKSQSRILLAVHEHASSYETKLVSFLRLRDNLTSLTGEETEWILANDQLTNFHFHSVFLTKCRNLSKHDHIFLLTQPHTHTRKTIIRRHKTLPKKNCTHSMPKNGQPTYGKSRFL